MAGNVKKLDAKYLYLYCSFREGIINGLIVEQNTDVDAERMTHVRT
jgi:hypothetical protein